MRENNLQYKELTNHSWKLRDVTNDQNNPISEKTTYKINGEVITQMNSPELSETIKSKYFLDTVNREITIEYQNSKWKYKIEKLTTEEFNIKNSEGKVIRNIPY
ncbi:hypothetical protein [Flavobacterium sp.]|uniref:hypothetical protein n=1 Tax=Flavobacterium sp. TaxID=239 RepID=UPI0039E44088